MLNVLRWFSSSCPAKLEPFKDSSNKSFLKHVSSRLFVALFMSLLLLRLCCLNGASWIHHRSLNLDLRDNNDTFDTIYLRSNLNSVHEKPIE